MEPKRENKLLRRLSGYQKANRDRFLLFAFADLSVEEFVVYELCVAITDWDPRHFDYGTFKASNSDLAQILNWKSGSSVCRYRKKLIEKNVITKLGDRFRVKDFNTWELRKNSAKKQNSNQNMHTDNAIAHDEFAGIDDI